MYASAQTDEQVGRQCHRGPSCYSPPLIALSGPEPLGGYCHSSHIGRQTGDNSCSLPFDFPPTDWSAPDRLFRRGISGLVVWRPQRQTRGMEVAPEPETETPTWCCRRELLSDLWTWLTNHQPVKTLRYSQCLEHRNKHEPVIPGVPDIVLWTKLGPRSTSQ